MDTSGTYIKMCGGAEEIQGLRNPMGDYMSCSYRTGDVYFKDGKIGYESHRAAFTAIWLPRQDQLQEMVLPDLEAKDAWGEPFEIDLKDDNVFWLFLEFSKSLQERKYSQQTGEQLWLRYVMKEKFNKVWDGEKWLKH